MSLLVSSYYSGESLQSSVVTSPAHKRYQDTILPYLFDHFSIDRAAEIDLSIAQTVASPSSNPSVGTKEKYLNHLESAFRFILHKESRNFEIKIIYFTSKKNQTIFVTDFFPTLMDPDKISYPSK